MAVPSRQGTLGTVLARAVGGMVTNGLAELSASAGTLRDATTRPRDRVFRTWRGERPPRGRMDSSARDGRREDETPLSVRDDRVIRLAGSEASSRKRLTGTALLPLIEAARRRGASWR